MPAALLSEIALLAAHAVPDYASAVFALIAAAPFVVVLLPLTFRQAFADDGLSKWLRTVSPPLGLFIVLIFFGTSTPVRYFHSWAILFATTAAFLLCITTGEITRFLRLRRLISAIFLLWFAAATINLLGSLLFEPIWVTYPNGVSLGYNLSFLFYAVSIAALLSIYPIGSQLVTSRYIWFLGIAGGCLLGYLISVPAIRGICVLPNPAT